MPLVTGCGPHARRQWADVAFVRGEVRPAVRQSTNRSAQRSRAGIDVPQRRPRGYLAGASPEPRRKAMVRATSHAGLWISAAALIVLAAAGVNATAIESHSAGTWREGPAPGRCATPHATNPDALPGSEDPAALMRTLRQHGLAGAGPSVRGGGASGASLARQTARCALHTGPGVRSRNAVQSPVDPGLCARATAHRRWRCRSPTTPAPTGARRTSSSTRHSPSVCHDHFNQVGIRCRFAGQEAALRHASRAVGLTCTTMHGGAMAALERWAASR
jgi:hypothetical protein